MRMNKFIVGFFIVGILAGCKNGCGEKVARPDDADTGSSVAVVDPAHPSVADRMKMDSKIGRAHV